MSNLVENEENTIPVQDIFLDDPTLQDPDYVDEDRDTSLNVLSDVSQKDLISHILLDLTCALAGSQALDPRAFQSKAHQIFAELAFDYVNKYNKLMPLYLIKEQIIEMKLKKQETWILAELASIDYMSPEAAEFWCDKILYFGQRYKIAKAYEEYTKKGETKVLFQKLAEAESLTQKGELKLFSPNELEGMPGVELLIANHFSKNSTVSIFGPSGAGKSFFCLDMALSLATGQSFLGKHETTKSKVLYINSEGSPNLRARIGAWKAKAKTEVDEIDSILFSVISHDLSDRAEINRLIKKAKERLGEIDVIFVDTLSRNFGEGDTDKNVDMARYLRSLDYFREQTGATVVNIHHTGHKDQDRERGAKELRNYSDTAISILGNADKQITVTVKKQKDLEEIEPYVLQSNKSNGSLNVTLIGSKSEIKASEAQTEAQTQIQELIDIIPDLELSVEATDKNTVTAKVIMEQTGWSSGKISKMVNQLITDNQIFKVRFGDHRTPFCYYRRSQVS